MCGLYEDLGMTQLQSTTTVQLHASIWQVLELVRLRQTPWHKKQAVFDKLQSLGLIEAIPQRTLTPSPHPALMIAALTDDGRRALEMRADQQAAIGRFLSA